VAPGVVHAPVTVSQDALSPQPAAVTQGGAQTNWPPGP
jgi:hypothetical protein